MNEYAVMPAKKQDREKCDGRLSGFLFISLIDFLLYKAVLNVKSVAKNKVLEISFCFSILYGWSPLKTQLLKFRIRSEREAHIDAIISQQ